MEPRDPPPEGPPPLEAYDPERGWVPVDDRRPPPSQGGCLERFPVTAVLGFVILGMFVVESQLGGTYDAWVLTRLGNVRHDLVFEHGEVYRLITAAFLHGGALHLFLNGLAFVQLGALSEHLYGSWRTLAYYLLSALGGTVLSAVFMRLPSVGASGAILGLAGLILGASWFADDPWRSELRRLLGRRLLYGVLLTFALGLGLHVFWIPIIDNWGHLGGLVVGLALSLLHRRPGDPAGSGVKVLAGVLVALSLGAFVWMAADGREAADRVGRDLFRVRWEMVEASPDGSLAEEFLPDLALFAMEARRDEEAQWALERWLAAAPDDHQAKNAMAWHLLTRPRRDLRDPAAALPLVEEAIDQVERARAEAWISDYRPDLAAYLDTQDEALRQLGRDEEARAVEARLVPLLEELLDQGAVGVLPVLYSTHARTEDADAAFAAARRWLEARPDDPAGLRTLARHLLERHPGDPLVAHLVLPLTAGAVEAYEAPGVVRRPTLVPPQALVSGVLYRDASAAEVPQLRPQLVDALDVHARALALVGRHVEAAAALRRALELASPDARALRAELTARLERAEAATK